ncbi:MAG TPA: MurR/RpiR family transcriptional regulator [Pseudolabrys sp.]|nr:MurR/RpiR family transcriptional regulator [Pseudolabrys sp.]
MIVESPSHAMLISIMIFLFVPDKGNFYSILMERPGPVRNVTRQRKGARAAADRSTARRPANTKPARSYADLNREISGRYESLSKRLRQIAEFALKHPNEIAIESIAVIAQHAGVQPSALIRFAKAFGFEGFSDLQRIFQQRLRESRPSYSERIAAMREELNAQRDHGPQAILTRFAEANIAALQHLCEETKAGDLDRAVQILRRAETIHLVAQRRSFPLAAYLYYALSKIGRRAHLIDAVGGMDTEQRQLMEPRDALVAVTYADYTPRVVETVTFAAQRKVPVIGITDQPLSPLTAQCDVVFYVEDAAVHDFRSLGASMCLAQALVVALGATG